MPPRLDLSRRRAIALALAVLLGSPQAARATIGVPFLVKDIQPAVGSNSFPAGFLTIGNTLFFSADDGTSGVEPWVSDGTPAGTHRLVDLQPGANAGFYLSTPSVAWQGRAWFGAMPVLGAPQVWASDATVAGTAAVQPAVLPYDFAPGASTLWFAGSTSPGGLARLYASDGTTPGTHLVSSKAFLTGYFLTPLGGRVFFPASDGNLGNELWVSDGTDPGTFMPVDQNPGASGSGASMLAASNGRMFYFAQAGPAQGLCRSDGTPAGTFRLAPMLGAGGLIDEATIVDLNGVALAIGNDFTHGYELWRSDGTVAGTSMITDLNPGSANGVTSRTIAVLGNYAYFGGDDGVHGPELWRTDGTAAGTTLVKDVNPFGSSGSDPQRFKVLNGAVFFIASDGGSHSYTPYVSDGTDAGTQKIADLFTGGPGAQAQFGYANGYVFFNGYDSAHGTELWAAAMAPAVGVTPVPGPARVFLAPNAPNPCTRSTTIRYTLPAAAWVRLRLFDVGGRAVRTVVDDAMEAGEHAARIDVDGLAAGLYLCRLEAAGQSAERKVLVAR